MRSKLRMWHTPAAVERLVACSTPPQGPGSEKATGQSQLRSRSLDRRVPEIPSSGLCDRPVVFRWWGLAVRGHWLRVWVPQDPLGWGAGGPQLMPRPTPSLRSQKGGAATTRGHP